MYHHEVLEHGDFSQRQQVVRWIRRFPFAFLSDREYTIARREFREPDGSIYACTKVGRAEPRAGRGWLVQLGTQHQVWAVRSGQSGVGSGQPCGRLQHNSACQHEIDRG